jgi:hypothetical protein
MKKILIIALVLSTAQLVQADEATITCPSAAISTVGLSEDQISAYVDKCVMMYDTKNNQLKLTSLTPSGKQQSWALTSLYWSTSKH